MAGVVLTMPRAAITSSTMRRALPKVKSSKNICDFCPVVPDEVRWVEISLSGIDSTSCVLKKLAWIGGNAITSCSVRSCAGSMPLAAKNARYHGERCWCQRVMSAIATTNAASVSASGK